MSRRRSRRVGALRRTRSPVAVIAAVCVVLGLIGPLASEAGATSTTFTVNTTADHATDGCAALPGGDCTLREAIIAAEATSDVDTIQFAIPGAGVHTIQPTSDYPLIGNPVIVDATTQPGYAGVPLIELDGSLVTSGNKMGFWVTGSGTTIAGFAINRFGNRGVFVQGSDSTIRANYVGTTADGTAAQGTFNFAAVEIQGADNTVGGTSAEDRNVIADGLMIAGGGAHDNVIEGNFVGTNAAGTAGISARAGVILGQSSNTTVGGTDPGATNLISGNAGNGIEVGLNATGVVIRRNLVGTNIFGTAAVPNTSAGMQIDGPGTIVGGTAIGVGNFVSGNSGDGIRLQTDHATAQGNFIGMAVGGGALGNGGAGVSLIGLESHDDTVGGTATGAGNTIANNGSDGIMVVNGTQQTLEGNEITDNVGLGIDLNNDGVTPNDVGDGDGGPNNGQNFPVIATATSGAPGSITGTLDSGAGSYRIEVFKNVVCDASGHGEGATYLDSVNTSNGTFTIPAALTVGDVVTATATAPDGNSSEFSACFTATDALADGPSWSVNTAADHDDGACTLVDCTLREAINRANATAGADTITFAIPGPGVHTIQPTSDYALITGPVVIDATTQPGYSGTPLIELDGSLDTTGNKIGLWIVTNSSTIAGFAINRFGNRGILVNEGTSQNVIRANYVGTTADGSAALGNFAFNAVEVRGNDNLVGGSTPADRNVIADGLFINYFGPGGANQNAVAGNYIGINAAGTAALGSDFGLQIGKSANTTVGGTDPGAGNVISGNSGNGVQVDINATGVQFLGNLVGTDATGTAAVPNGAGLQVSGPGTTIGGVSPGAGNVVSGNTGDGIRLQTDSAFVAGNLIGVAVGGGALGNGGAGVSLIGGESHDNMVGDGTAGGANTIANNGSDGISVINGSGQAIEGNSIHDNVGLGIDLNDDGVTPNDAGDTDGGPNGRQNFPLLFGAASGAPGTVSGTLDSGAGSYRIEFFENATCDASAHGEGAVYLGSVNTSNGTFAFHADVATGDVITATATAPDGDTSEFSGCVTAAEAASTSTTIDSVSANPTAVGQAYTVHWTVAVDPPGSGTPSGDVVVSDGAQSCTANAAVGSCPLTSTTAGSKTLTATFTPDAPIFVGSSGTAAHDVNAASTTATIVNDYPDPTLIGESYVVAWNVVADPPGAGTPVGTVTVSDGAGGSCTDVVSAAGCTMSSLTPGVNVLTATFTPADANFLGSSGTADHLVNKVPISFTRHASPEPSHVGESYAVSWNFVWSASLPTPTGTLDVSDGGGATCQGTVATHGCTLVSTSAGSKTITITYSGDDFWAGSAETLAHTVDAASTSTTITSDDPDPSVTGQPFTVTWTVSVDAPGAGTPTGTVTVSGGGGCSASVATGQCVVTPNSAGPVSLVAHYGGDGNFSGSDSAAANHAVNQAGTSTDVTSDDPDPSVTGQPYTVHWSVLVGLPGAGTPTGNVTVDDGTGATCSAAVAVGHCDLTSTSAGPKSLTATFAGDANFAGSAGVGAHQVDQASTGRIEVEEQTDPSGLSGFAFSGDLAGTIGDDGVLGANVTPGPYTVSELVPSGWTLDSIVCNDSDSTGAVPSATATFQVGAGETVRCVFTDFKDKVPTQLLAAVPLFVLQGNPVTITATVSETAPQAPTGSVSFYEYDWSTGDQILRGSSAIAAGVASLPLGSLAVGSHCFAAIYAGDGNFLGSQYLYACVTVVAPSAELVAVNDTVTTSQPALISVLTNDRPLGQVTTIDTYTQPAHGTVSCPAPDNYYTYYAYCYYIPVQGFHGSDSFTYTISQFPQTATATVHITVASAPPTAVHDSFTVLSGTQTFLYLTDNDTDPDIEQLTVTATSGGPAHGTLSQCNDNYGCNYTSAPGYSGPDSFTYQIRDYVGNTSSATVSLTVGNNHPPIAVNDTLAARGTGSYDLSFVTWNDSDPDLGDYIQPATSFSTPAHGSVTCAYSYSYYFYSCSYQATTGYTGADSFTYTIFDGHGATATGTVHVTVTANHPPTAVDDASVARSAASGTSRAQFIYAVGNDTDPDGDQLIVSSCAATHGTTQPFLGDCLYTPNVGYVGTDKITYVLSDQHGGTATAKIQVTVTADSPPVPLNPAVSVNSGKPAFVQLIGSSRDSDGDWTWITGTSGGPAHGTLSPCLYDSGCSYTPAVGYVGPDSFNYTITDGANVVSGHATITVIANRPPVAVADSVTARGAAPTYVSPLGNDTDPDFDYLQITGNTAAAHGSVACTAYSCSYAPVGGFIGTDSFQYTISDGAGHTATATITVKVLANRAPVAHADSATVASGGVVRIDILANDSDPDAPDDWFYPQSFTQPRHGFVTCYGLCQYASQAGFTGNDTFSYTLTDSLGLTATATVTVKVTAAAVTSLAAKSKTATANAKAANDVSAAATAATPAPVQVPASFRVSVSSAGAPPNAPAENPSVSSDGRYVAFVSAATNLVPNDTNGVADVFVRDSVKNTIERVSVGALLRQSDGPSSAPSISGDGRYVAFASDATNLANGDTNSARDVFVFDRVALETKLVSVASIGGAGGGASGTGRVAISGNGRFVTFASDAANLVPNDSNGTTDVFVYDLQSSTMQLVSVGPAGAADGPSGEPAISSDGRAIAFSSDATNLVTGDANGKRDVFVRDRLAGVTRLASTVTGGALSDGNSGEPAINGDGTILAFSSTATNLAPDSNGFSHVYRHDLVTGETRRVSERTGGGAGHGDSRHPALDGSGRYVVFDSDAADLVPNDTNQARDVFVNDSRDGRTWRASVASGGVEASGVPHPDSAFPAVDASGAHIVIASSAANLLGKDGNGTNDVYALPLFGGVPLEVSVGDVTVREGDQGTRDAVFTLTLSQAPTKTVTVKLSTLDGTAFAGSDFTAVTNQIVTFAAGATSKTVTIPIRGDTIAENDETFVVNLSSPTNALIGDGVGLGTIVDDDSPTSATPTLAVSDVTVHEGSAKTTTMTFTVSLSKAATSSVTVKYATANGTATSGTDYTAVSGTLTFAKGTTSKTLTVAVSGDTAFEQIETFTLGLSTPVGATIAKPAGTGTILDDD